MGIRAEAKIEEKKRVKKSREAIARIGRAKLGAVTDQEAAAIEARFSGLGMAASLVAAGYPPARVNAASEWWAQPHIEAFVRARTVAVNKRLELTKEDVVRGLWRIAKSDPGEVAHVGVDGELTLKDWDSLTADQRRCIKAIVSTEREKDGEVTRRVQVSFTGDVERGIAQKTLLEHFDGAYTPPQVNIAVYRGLSRDEILDRMNGGKMLEVTADAGAAVAAQSPAQSFEDDMDSLAESLGREL